MSEKAFRREKGTLSMTKEMSATDLAIRALTRSKGATATQLQEETGWQARPSGTFLRALADRKGFKYASVKGADGLLIHTFTPKKVAAKATARKPVRKAEARAAA
jgi:hypothetical protein